MDFEWDAAKSDRNLRERGIGFEVAVHALDHVIESIVDRRRDYRAKFNNVIPENLPAQSFDLCAMLAGQIYPEPSQLRGKSCV